MQKSKKFVVLATYVIAVICLLAGLFLPLFEGKSLLALQLPDVFKSLLNKELGESSKYAEVAYPVHFFGAEKAFDFRALVIVLYAVITALALVAFAPIILSIRKEGKLAVKLYYAIEIAAVIVLSLYLIIALQFYTEFGMHYNMVIALGGAFIALVALCALDKGKNGAVKIVLFLLSTLAFLTLFNFVIILDKLTEFADISAKVKLGSGFVYHGDGAGYLTILFGTKLSETFVEAGLTSAKLKALTLLAAICATVVLVNYFIDAVRLGTGNNDKKETKAVHIFNIARYGLELALAICVLATTLICKSYTGIMLIILMIAVAIQLTIVVIRFVRSILKSKKPVTEVKDEETTELTIWKEPEPATVVTAEEPVEEIAEAPVAETVTDEEEIDLTPPFDDLPEEVEEKPVSEEIKEEKTEEAIEEKPEEEEILPDDFTGPLFTEPTESFKKEPVYIEPDIMPNDPTEDDTVYVENPEVVPEVEVSPIPEGEEIAEPETEETVEEPVLEKAVETKEEEILPENTPDEDEEDDELEEELEEVKKEPEVEKKEDSEPYNPYMHRDNPFRAYEHNAQSEPYNPYTQRKPSNPFEKTYTTYEPKPAEPKPVEKPVERPVEKPVEPKPVQHTYKPYEPATEKRSGVKPLQPRPIIQEFKPVPPVNEQPPKDPHIYTIDTIYAGPMDDFIRKLSNDERIEFAKTFIEKNRGDLGNIPDYVVGGENKKFFNVAFIYLGRIRGLVSDGLLNKMYKELNLL